MGIIKPTLFFIRCFLFLFLFSANLQAQSPTSSLYSQYGFGEIQSPGFARNFGMGGLYTAISTSNAINIGNPASYAAIELTTLEAGVASNFVKYKAMDNSVPNGVSNNTVVRYLAFAFPVSKKWGTSVGLVPFSNMGYASSFTQNTAIGTGHFSYKGAGSINQFYLGNAFKITKSLSIGLNISYLFGNITKQKSLAFEPSSGALNTLANATVNVGDFYFNYGALYNLSLPDDYSISFGLTGALTRNMNSVLNAVSLQYFERNGIAISRDTGNYVADKTGKTLIPGYVSGGLSFKKNAVWMFGIDYQIQDWSKYSSFATKDSLTNSSKVSVGGEYNYKKFQYRAGLRYEETNLLINTVHLKEYAFSAGLGIPLSRGFSYMNISGELAERGALSNGLVREHYFRIMVGLTLSDRWFIQRKFD
jgi:hypothetical protein